MGSQFESFEQVKTKLDVPQENKIYDLKKKNQELEKFKFVLDFKIKELKKQLDPKDNQIREMKEQISAVSIYVRQLLLAQLNILNDENCYQQMEVELNRFRLDNEKLELEINVLKQKLGAADREIREERTKVKRSARAKGEPEAAAADARV